MQRSSAPPLASSSLALYLPQRWQNGQAAQKYASWHLRSLKDQQQGLLKEFTAEILMYESQQSVLSPRAPIQVASVWQPGQPLS